MRRATIFKCNMTDCKSNEDEACTMTYIYLDKRVCANFEEKESVKKIKEIRAFIEENTEDDFLNVATLKLDCPHSYNMPENNVSCMNGCWRCWKSSVLSSGMNFKKVDK
ncbi:hypothetical protein [Clostridium beijerinckii]|uniref:hypothetical protein n=1 Tax=Clostridium beijerinckii TaxID=1520 RepID=UPI00098C4A18|nr:hypothetical protein [Clostridium beijerinckii]NRT76322.1 hypothetical protein [Clostridium beijerinckii]OOM48641.1 hypothetical protein CBEIJ_21130 [Clostridium beijerinckii]